MYLILVTGTLVVKDSCKAEEGNRNTCLYIQINVNTRLVNLYNFVHFKCERSIL